MRTNSQKRYSGIAGTALALMVLAAVAAGQTKVGTTAAQFLGISVGPRAVEGRTRLRAKEPLNDLSPWERMPRTRGRLAVREEPELQPLKSKHPY